MCAAPFDQPPTPTDRHHGLKLESYLDPGTASSAIRRKSESFSRVHTTTGDPVVPAGSALGLAQPFGQYPHRKQGDIETGYSHYPRMCVVAPDGAVTRTVDESSDWVGLF